MPRTLILGASVGGVRTAQALRASGYDGEILIADAESSPPYDRPPLSKSILAGHHRMDEIRLLAEGEAAESALELLPGHRSMTLHAPQRTVTMTNGSTLTYDDLVVATGAAARPSPWGTPAGVHILRSASDAVALRYALEEDGPVVIIGAGFIGTEVAATAISNGHTDVTLIDPADTPLTRILPATVARAVFDLHRNRGVKMRFGTGVTRIAPHPRGLQVHLTDDSVRRARTVVLGIGAVPNDQWLAPSGVAVNDGVLCDEYGRSTSTPHVWAVGDVARWRRPDTATSARAEHWTNAVEQAGIVAHNLTHNPDQLRPHNPIDYVWTDQYDWKIQLVGQTGTAKHCLRVAPQGFDRSFAEITIDHHGTTCGGVAVNWPRAFMTCRRALRAPVATRQSAQELADTLASM